ncbi:MAG: hypothetical protein ACPGVG_15735, partial [Mycobacterium sp.]
KLMAATVTQNTQNLKSLDSVVRSVAFTSTTATVEVDVGGLSEIYHWEFARHGAADADDAGYLSLSETHTAGVTTVDADGEVTVVRQPLASGGTLTAESFTMVFYGKS